MPILLTYSPTTFNLVLCIPTNFVFSLLKTSQAHSYLSLYSWYFPHLEYPSPLLKLKIAHFFKSFHSLFEYCLLREDFPGWSM